VGLSKPEVVSDEAKLVDLGRKKQALMENSITQAKKAEMKL